LPAWSPVEAVADTTTADLNGTARGTQPDHVSDRSSEKDEAGGRGNLVIKERVVERIAGAAALQVPGVAPAAASTSTVGAALGRAYPRVDCDVAGRRVRAHVEIVGLWPSPAARLGAEVRDAVTEQLQRLAGLRVDAVDVTIANVVRATATTRRRVQ
jgi:uncharacterized alkaline shock family protein YloU